MADAPDRPITAPTHELLQRVGVLERMGLAGELPPAVFARLTLAATRVSGVRVGLTSLVDERAQVFIAQVGLGEPWASLGQAPLSQSFCRLVAESGVPLIVSDARQDERVSEHPAFLDHGVVAYAGMPLRAGGVCVGALCLIDGEPHAWSSHELLALGALAESATAELEAHLASVERAPVERPSPGEALYRSLTAAMSDGVVLQDRSGAVLDCNAAAQAMLGLTVGLGPDRSSSDRPWQAVTLDGHALPAEDHPSMRTLRTGLAIRDEVIGIRRPDGSLAWLSVCTEPWRAIGARRVGSSRRSPT